MYCRSALLLVCLHALLFAVDAKTGPKTTEPTVVQGGGTGSNPNSIAHAGVGHHGPYESFGNSLDKSKKAKFFATLKKLKETKNGDLPEAKKNATKKVLNTELLTLLGAEKFANYQQIHRRQAQNFKNLKKDTTAPKGSPAVKAAAATGGASVGTVVKKPSSQKSSQKKASSASGRRLEELYNALVGLMQ